MKNALAQNIAKLRDVGASEVVMGLLKQGVQFPGSDEVGSFEFPNKQFTHAESTFICKEVQNL